MHIAANQGRQAWEALILQLIEDCGPAWPGTQGHTKHLKVQGRAPPAAGDHRVAPTGPRRTDQEVTILLKKSLCLLGMENRGQEV